MHYKRLQQKSGCYFMLTIMLTRFFFKIQNTTPLVVTKITNKHNLWQQCVMSMHKGLHIKVYFLEYKTEPFNAIRISFTLGFLRAIVSIVSLKHSR